MRNTPIIDVIIPAFNEAESLPLVLAALPKDVVRHVLVCDNGSTDSTAEKAREAGAIVVFQALKGYGNACLKGIEYLRKMPIEEQPDIVVFLDADYSDFPEELPLLVQPILDGEAEMVIGSRARGNMERGAMTVPQRFGNWLAPALIQLFWGIKFTDLGPFRAITWSGLLNLNMVDTNFGWTVEMQAKAAKRKLPSVEIPVSYRQRAGGKSKVSGTIKGTFKAGWKILYTIGVLVFRDEL